MWSRSFADLLSRPVAVILFQAILLVYKVHAIIYKYNGTGATFPDLVYQEATFAYRFMSPSEQVSYFGTGSTAGTKASYSL